MSEYYKIVKERYAKIGVDTEDAIKKIAINTHFNSLLAR
jgi:L-rhamnose isomerase